MAKNKTIYVCNQCGAQSPQWAGQCTDCNAWNSFSELQTGLLCAINKGYAGSTAAEVLSLNTLSSTEQPRMTTGMAELDRVLGGGLVPGSVILMEAIPELGKSTILLQRHLAN